MTIGIFKEGTMEAGISSEYNSNREIFPEKPE